MLRSHPSVGRDLLSQVPRLKLVGEIISRQGADLDGAVATQPSTADAQVLLGAALLRLALDVD